MKKNPPHVDGHFCWNQIATSNIESAVVFYSALFGWELVEEDLGVGDQMVRLTLGDDFVVGIHQVDQDNAPHWQPHIAVADLNALLTRVRESEGAVLEEPHDLAPYGVMAEVADPSGTKSCLWSAKSFGGHGHIPKEGIPRWYTLHLPPIDPNDEEAVEPDPGFWANLFGWSEISQEDEEHVFGDADGTSFASIVLPTGDEAPHHGWIAFVAVEDVEKVCKDAIAIDGKLIVEPHRVDGKGSLAILADPQGAIFGVICPD